MAEAQLQFLEVGNEGHKRTIAFMSQPANVTSAISLIWLPGLKSDMVSTKAAALAQWAPQNGFGLTRFDYSGHGKSSGEFETATIGDWLEETSAVLERATEGPQILVGSSTGGHIALVLLRDLLREKNPLAGRIRGLVLIAPAWDLTEELMWKTFPDEAKRDLMEKGFYDMPSDYGEPYRISRAFIENGRQYLLAREPFDPGRPIRILQGQMDTAVPADHTCELLNFVKPSWVEIVQVPDGEHRLSRPQDLQRLYALITDVARHADD